MASQPKPLDFRQLQIQLSKNKPKALYFLFGEEVYLINEALKTLVDQSITRDARDFNFDQLYAGDSSSSKVKDLVETFPMMCERRVLVYKQVHLLKESDWKTLMPLVTSPIDTCVLIFVADKIDKRKKAIKELLNCATCVELKKPFDNQVPAWAQYIAEQRGLSLDQRMAYLLVQLVGNQLSDLDNELLKLSQYLGDDGKLTEEVLLKVVSRSRVENVFGLTDAIGEGNKVKALNLLGSLLSNGHNEIGILSLVGRHIRVLSQLLRGQAQGLGGAQLAKSAEIPSFFLPKYQSQMRHWSEPKLVSAIALIHQTDLRLKSTSISNKTWLESFLLNLMNL